MGAYGFVISVLLAAGLIIFGALRMDFMTKRGYGLLALALLAAVALGYLWPLVLDADAQIDSWGGSPDSLEIGMVVAIYTFATILAIALLGIAGSLEMAVARRWWWLVGLLAAMALMVATNFLPLFFNLLTVLPLPIPNSSVLRDANWLAGEAIVFLVCVGYGVRATWFRSWPAA